MDRKLDKINKQYFRLLLVGFENSLEALPPGQNGNQFEEFLFIYLFTTLKR